MLRFHPNLHTSERNEAFEGFLGQVGWLLFLPLVSLWVVIFHYDLQAWFSFQSLNMGLSPSMVLIHGIHLPKSFLPSHPATFRKTQEGPW